MRELMDGRMKHVPATRKEASRRTWKFTLTAFWIIIFIECCYIAYQAGKIAGSHVVP